MDTCHFCDSSPEGFGASILGETGLFWILRDAHPLTEGHMLLVPKQHVAAVGAYDEEHMEEFRELFEEAKAFLVRHYGRVAWFEHGVLGQTIFHSHVHLVPSALAVSEIVPEGPDHVSLIDDVEELKWLLESEGGYLALGIGDEEISIVDAELAEPRFFRTRFANALLNPVRADWRALETNEAEMKVVRKELDALRELWIQDAVSGDQPAA